MDDIPPLGTKVPEPIRISITLPGGNTLNLTTPDNEVVKGLGALMLAALELYVHASGMKKPAQGNLLMPNGTIPRLRN